MATYLPTICGRGQPPAGPPNRFRRRSEDAPLLARPQSTRQLSHSPWGLANFLGKTRRYVRLLLREVGKQLLERKPPSSHPQNLVRYLHLTNAAGDSPVCHHQSGGPMLDRHAGLSPSGAELVSSLLIDAFVAGAVSTGQRNVSPSDGWMIRLSGTVEVANGQEHDQGREGGGVAALR